MGVSDKRTIQPQALELRFRPVTAETLADLDIFRQRNPGFRECSCMRWRLTRAALQSSTPLGRARVLDALFMAGTPVGILAYANDVPIGWCSIAPRETCKALEKSASLARIDDAAVWSVVCFFIENRWRRKGISLRLLRAAVEYARTAGAKIIEGYPVEPGARIHAQMGSPSTFPGSRLP